MAFSFCACRGSANAEETVSGYFSALREADFETAQSCLSLPDAYEGLIEDLNSTDCLTRLNAECFVKAVYQRLEANILNVAENDGKYSVVTEITAVDAQELTALAFESISRSLSETAFSELSEEQRLSALAEIFTKAYENAYSSAEKRRSRITVELTVSENGNLKIKSTKELFDAISGRKIPDA